MMRRKRKKKRVKKIEGEKKYIDKKKREVSEEGSKSEPARSTRVKRLPYTYAFKLRPYTSAEKTFCCLAPPILALARACKSLAIVLIRF